ncbi:ArsR/SmtB family transcription factor [Paenibacillus arenilitoris]|uniref:ArsR family transcriptional regulator n=1 Tax=Paenibacillus arenilitoris TaxID=2772299 RepID=A0A927H508_9BACL|nr:ArsR family transcriptional regulator [Paenibacillus arenilitoris]MBD2868053.1 ArsR family transcriptional regulator [Paenibacillus arenilitoris]
MNIEVNSSNLKFLECFASDTRVKIIELLNVRPMNIKDLAEALGISSAIVTKHVQKLEEALIVTTESVPSTRGRQKICHLTLESATLQFKAKAKADQNRYAVSIPIGQYSAYEVKPTCGLSSDTRIIGMVDDPRYFSDPEHVKACHLWFGSGYIEYRVPNYLVGRQRARSIAISLEICSEAPKYNENWPSDLSFYMNDICLGVWTCPGDFGAVKGVYTPAWWGLGTQHGLLKQITVDADGSYIDGIRMSDVTVQDLAIGYGEDIRFRISAPETATHSGGLSMFGRQFGNYDQDILVYVGY